MKQKFDMKNLLDRFKKKEKQNNSSGDEKTKGAEKVKKTFFEQRQKAFEKVGDFFNYEPQKEKVLSKEDFNGAGDIYYASVFALYKVIERFLWLLLVIFLVFSVATNSREITFNNLVYLFKDFSSVSDTIQSEYAVLSYDSYAEQKYALYRGGVVTASPNTASIFTAGGRRTFKDNNDYNSPNIISCDKYVMIYDTEGASYSIYNSFSKIHTEKLDAPIADACFDKSGAFAVLVRSNDIQNQVFVYDDNLNKKAGFKPEGFVFDIALDYDKGKAAVLSYEASSGVGKTLVKVYDIKKNASKPTEFTIDGDFPLNCTFLENGTLVVVTNSSVRMFERAFDGQFKELQSDSETYVTSNVSAFCGSENGVAVVIGEDSQKKILLVDKDAKKYIFGTTENVKQIGVSGKFVFLNTVSGVYRINIKDKDNAKAYEFLPAAGGDMLVYGDDTAIVCGASRAEYLVFGK